MIIISASRFLMDWPSLFKDRREKKSAFDMEVSMDLCIGKEGNLCSYLKP